MSDWLLNLPVLWMGALILGAIYAFTAGLYLLITALAVGERARAFKGISPGVLSPLAIIFALLVGFLAAQVWNDADRANTAVNREASALRAAVLLAAAFPGEPEARLRELIRSYIQDAVSQEWPAMARCSNPSRVHWRHAGSASFSADHRSTGSSGPCCSCRRVLPWSLLPWSTATIAPRTASSWQSSLRGSGSRSS
jgi:hypothetical protein